MARDDPQQSDSNGSSADLHDGRGRGASSPTEIPAKGWRDILLRAWKESGTDNVGMIAAGVAFYGFLALVPMLGAFILTYGLVADPQTVVGHVQSLSQMLPADAAKLIGDQLIQLTQQSSGKTGLGLALSIVISLYGAMKGATAIMTALDIAYDEEEERSFIVRNLLAFGITLVAVIVGVIGMLAVGALAALERLMPGAPAPVLFVVRLAFWLGAALAASFALATLYRYGPDRDEPKWRWLTPGAVFATVGWIILTFGFALYTSHFANYNATYGALGAVVVLLMWLYFSAYVVLLGAEVNAEMEHQTARDTTKGPEQPMGARDAYVADTIGEVPSSPLAGMKGKSTRPPSDRPEARAGDRPGRYSSPAAAAASGPGPASALTRDASPPAQPVRRTPVQIMPLDRHSRSGDLSRGFFAGLGAMWLLNRLTRGRSRRVQAS